MNSITMEEEEHKFPVSKVIEILTEIQKKYGPDILVYHVEFGQPNEPIHIFVDTYEDQQVVIIE
jgi:hypothetical protein